MRMLPVRGPISPFRFTYLVSTVLFLFLSSYVLAHLPTTATGQHLANRATYVAAPPALAQPASRSNGRAGGHPTRLHRLQQLPALRAAHSPAPAHREPAPGVVRVDSYLRLPRPQ